MEPGPGQGGAGLYLEGTGRPRPRAAFCCGSEGAGFRCRAGRGRLQAPGGTGCGGQIARHGRTMTQRCGFCAIIGAPNAGKSTLVNALVGSKVAIVSPKVQTTRMPVRGIAMAGETQIIFVDTPGIFRPRRRLDRAMVTSAWVGAEEADAVLLIVDATDLSERAPAARDTMAILEGLKGEVGGQANRTPSAEGAKAGRKGRKTALVLNKIDGMKRTDLLPLVEKFHAAGIFEDVFLISALKGEAVADVATWVAARMPEGPWLYPED